MKRTGRAARPLKLLTLADRFKVSAGAIDGWELHTIPRSLGVPNLCHLPPHKLLGSNHITDYIGTVRPDFVLIMCEGCTERHLNRMSLPKGPKYITWSTDSYRHTERVTNSDLHLSAIPDASLRAGDHFLPLFAGDHALVGLTQRTVHCGIVCRSYGVHEAYRERELDRLAAVMPALCREDGLTEAQYNRRICDFAYGVNVAVYPDALPNFRSFQLGRAGVMPVCSTVQRPLLESLFGEYILLFDDIEQVPALLATHRYDEVALKSYYDEKHCFAARLRELFDRFYGLVL